MALYATFALAVAAAPVLAQPSTEPDQAARALSSYVYLMDSAGHKVLVSTKFWRNDPKYDDRSFHRFLDVLDALEKRGFRQSEKAAIRKWDGTAPFARCFIYLEDLQAGRKAKGGTTSGARVWCSESGVSEVEIDPSDNPKHVAQVMDRFDTFLERAKQNLQK
jgi:hypothetical protein